ncbi:hypothetical protein OF364_02915 [Mycoplasma enhydrae]|uniref:BC85_0335 family putative methyltransferase n=1 Tax=Mycoplasma enhydrae TaxID=2499220 RepID=UPI00197B5716|nr:hypothetical protein [Mycoplasma enhydrae]MBN4089203.1 hypothetical protein [Mycoplasma enhydrae]MCV3733886.1 hypothetical protein [Mycoplasma enhydrae]MCV3753753.1 hypothetical protein [Mycoplasma enhydrae]
MKTNQINYSLIKGSGSKISPETRLGLVISIVVVLLIAIIVLILSLWYRKKVAKKYLSPSEETEIAKLKANNPNYGIVLNGIKPLYKDFANDFLVCFLINTIYINKYQNIFIQDNDDYIALSIANLSNDTNVLYKGDINQEIRANIANNYPEISLDKLQVTTKLKNNVDFMLFFDDGNSNLESNLNQNLQYLNDKGMIIFSISNYKQAKNHYPLFKELNLRYETLKFKNKSVILLAKGNIKDRVEKGE